MPEPISIALHRVSRLHREILTNDYMYDGMPMWCDCGIVSNFDCVTRRPKMKPTIIKLFHFQIYDVLPITANADPCVLSQMDLANVSPLK